MYRPIAKSAMIDAIRAGFCRSKGRREMALELNRQDVDMPQDTHHSRNVVDMTQIASANRFPAIKEVEAYWESLRAGRLVPRRSDIDPRGIERSLEFAFILERIAPGLARLRIAGSHLTELMGMEVRGMPISAFFTPTGRNQMSEALEDVFDGPSKVTLDLHAETGMGKPAISARMIMLPLKSDLGDISRVLGCFATKGDIGRTPRRFEIDAVEKTPLLGDAFRGFDTPKEEDDVTAPLTNPLSNAGPDVAPIRPVETPGLSEPRATFQHKTTDRSSIRPYLRLVKTDTQD